MSNKAKDVKETSVEAETKGVAKPTFKVIADGGVYVRPTNNFTSTTLGVLNKGTTIVAEEVLDGWVRTKDGYVVDNGYSLEEL